jgi:hypothetical protein
MRRYNNEAVQAKPVQLIKNNYLFICAINGTYIAQIIAGQVSTIKDAMQLFGNMFPTYTQVGIFKTTILEAGLMAVNFNRQALSTLDYAVGALNVSPQSRQIFVGNVVADIGTPVYTVNNEYGIAPVLQKTEHFLGYIVNPDYFNLTFKLFGHDWRTK